MMRRKYSFWFVFYSIVVLMLSTNIPSPLYNIYKQKYDFSSLILTLIFATYAIVLIPALAMFGRASDRYGRKRMIGFGIIVSIAGTTIFAVSSSVAMLFVARAFQGLAVGMLSGAATAVLIELNPYKNKHTAAIASSIATAGGTALGPLISGCIAQYLPFPEISPYLAHVLMVVPSLIGLLWVEETIPSRNSEKPVNAQTTLPEDIKRPFISAAMTAFLAWAVTALFMSVIPSYVSALMHVHNLALSGGVVFLMLSSSVVTQLVLRQITYISSMISGLIILSLGVATIILAVPLESISLLLAGTIAAGVGQGLSFKGSMKLVNTIAPLDQRGRIVSLLYIYIYLGVGLPIIGVGVLSIFFGLYNAICYFASAIGIVSLVIIPRLVKDTVKIGVIHSTN